jgi:hypothetical protein
MIEKEQYIFEEVEQAQYVSEKLKKLVDLSLILVIFVYFLQNTHIWFSILK